MKLLKYNQAGKKRLTLLGILFAVIMFFLVVCIGARFVISKTILAYQIMKDQSFISEFLVPKNSPTALTDLAHTFKWQLAQRKVVHQTILLDGWRPDLEEKLTVTYEALKKHPQMQPENLATLEVLYTTYGNCCKRHQDRKPMAQALGMLSPKEKFTDEAFIHDYRYQLAYRVLYANTHEAARTPMLFRDNYWLSLLLYGADGGTLMGIERSLSIPLDFTRGALSGVSPLFKDLNKLYSRDSHQKIYQIRIGYQLFLMKKFTPYFLSLGCQDNLNRFYHDAILSLVEIYENLSDYQYVKKAKSEFSEYMS
ncbi:MAG: hypothetical protein OXR68_00410, partial [Alphaproteobacteria bacterium]|nr:hypothetical protein [Alphaproteobacteria bacterium]